MEGVGVGYGELTVESGGVVAAVTGADLGLGDALFISLAEVKVSRLSLISAKVEE